MREIVCSIYNINILMMYRTHLHNYVMQDNIKNNNEHKKPAVSLAFTD